MDDEIQLDLSRYQTEQGRSFCCRDFVCKAICSDCFEIRLFSLFACYCLFNLLLALVGDQKLSEFFLLTIYSLMVGIVLGFVLGLMRVLSQLLGNCEKLLKMIIETAKLAAHDIAAVRAGNKKMPTATDVVTHVYEDVFLPLIEKSVAEAIGIVGVPLLWLYRLTIGSGVRYVLAKMQAESITEDDEVAVGQVVENSLSTLADQSQYIETALDGALGVTNSASQMVRRLILLPMQLLFAIVLLIALVPMVVYWIWFQ